MEPYRILSIDGGGIRGIISTILLQRLSAEPALAGWLQKCRLIAGTSTGGLLALAIAKPLDLQAIRDVYANRGKEIFKDTWIDDLHDLDRIIGAEYRIANLARVLGDLFGEATLAQFEKRVLITSFDLDNEAVDPAQRTWKPKIFHNFPGPGSDEDRLARRVGLYTAAAPTYFESADGYVDGGVFANNPSMCALAQSQDPRSDTGAALTDVTLFSLGTGTSLTYIKGASNDWGYAQWAKPLVSLILDGLTGIADYQCQQLLRERYCRLAPVFPLGKTLAMDAVDRIPEMIDFANQVPLAPTVEWIRSRWIG